MIPLQLQIKNFLSYGPELQTIDFSAYHLICLSGKNGHGKSALLDAITWSLWGQARKIAHTSRADQGLLRLGQTSMLVVYDFMFNDVAYRVRREFSCQYNKPHLNLDFGLLDMTTQELIPLTEKTIRGTQIKIESLLNLDYESFVNSAFLRQGASNEFSKKSPRERKQVLATILGLDHYERLRKQACEKVKEITAQKQVLFSLHTKNIQDSSHYADVKTKRTMVIDMLTDVTEQEKVCLQVQEKLIEQKKIYLEKQQQACVVLFQQQQAQEQEQQQIAQLQKTIKAWKDIHKKVITWHIASDIHAQREQLAVTLQRLQEQIHTKVTLQQKILQQKEVLYALSTRLEEEDREKLQQNTQDILDVTYQIQRCKQLIQEYQGRQAILSQDHALLQQKLHMLQEGLQNSKESVHTLEVHTKQFEKRKTAYQLWVAQGNWLITEQKAIAEKQKLAQDETNPSCPLCEQHLSASRKRFLKQAFIQRTHQLTHRIARLQNLTQSLKALLLEQHETITRIKKQQTEYVQMAAQLQELELLYNKQQLEQQEYDLLLAKLDLEKVGLEQKEVRLRTHYENAKQLQAKQMQEHPLYIKESHLLQEYEQQIKELVCDPQHYMSVCEQLKQIDTQIADKARIHDLQATKQSYALTVKELCDSLRLVRHQKKTYATTLQEYGFDVQAIHELESQEAALQAKLKNHAEHKHMLLEDKGRLDNEHEKLRFLEQEILKQKEILAEYEFAIIDYQTIAHATSKEGVQALLIEEAIPEIEQEANQLLSRLTQNQAQVFIESLKDLKKGGTKETLDIKISDAAGIRPYELFSGGEAFRIDFALRIALSKLLARRAGTSLQTLIIDEGFGSQDEEGLSHIMEALYKIQDDFSKIIIVSHLDTMKNQFPVHMHVEKGAQGSRVSIIEQG